MGTINPSLPTIGQSNSTEDPDIVTCFTAILAEFNGNIDNNNIKSSAAIAWSKLATLNTGQIVVGNAGVPTAVTLSGDATVDNTGVLTIGNAKVSSNKANLTSVTQAATATLTAKTTADGIFAITGATSTTASLTANNYAIVNATFDVQITNGVAGSALNALVIGYLYLDGVAQSGTAIWYPQMADVGAAAVARQTISQNWRVSLSSGGTHTLDLRAQIGTAGYTLDVFITNTKFTYFLISQ